MRNIIKKLKHNLSQIDKSDIGYASIVVAFAIINLALLAFVPVTTIIQDLFVLLTSGAVLFMTFDAFWGSSPDDSADLISSCDYLIFSTFVALILWMFPISLLWSIIPFTLALALSKYCNGKDWGIVENFFVAFLLLIVLSMAQSNIDAKNYLAENPKAEVVVVDNVDLPNNVIFVDQCEESARFYNLRTKTQAYDLDIKKGDTLKIVRHPDSPSRIIKVSK